MSTEPHHALETPLRQELSAIRDSWLLLLILGISLVVIGTMSIVFSFFATLAVASVFGALLLIGGVMQLVNAGTCRNWRGFVVYLLAGILYAVVGLIMMNNIGVAALAMTLMLAALFMTAGTIRIIVAVVEHFYGWPWVLVNGFLSLLIGIYIWRHFPTDAFWVIGLFVGIELIFGGWSWIILAIGIRRAFPHPA